MGGGGFRGQLDTVAIHQILKIKFPVQDTHNQNLLCCYAFVATPNQNNHSGLLRGYPIISHQTKGATAI